MGRNVIFYTKYESDRCVGIAQIDGSAESIEKAQFNSVVDPAEHIAKARRERPDGDEIAERTA